MSALPQVRILRAHEMPGFVGRRSEGRVAILIVDDMLNGMANETVASCDKDDLGHGVREVEELEVRGRKCARLGKPRPH